MLGVFVIICNYFGFNFKSWYGMPYGKNGSGVDEYPAGGRLPGH
jgi:hypothetical protein